MGCYCTWYASSIHHYCTNTQDIAHVVVTPSVTKGTLDIFIDEYTKEHAQLAVDVSA